MLHRAGFTFMLYSLVSMNEVPLKTDYLISSLICHQTVTTECIDANPIVLL
jgi:hypothetical protein